MGDVFPCHGEFNFFHSEALKLMKNETHEISQYFSASLHNLAINLNLLLVEIGLLVISWRKGIFREIVPSVDSWFKLLDSLLISEDSSVKIHAFILLAL